ncbi:MAG TPA: cytochrome c [Sphingomonas sp.]|nr:cytochrome c [Sphingomonas sp.]
MSRPRGWRLAAWIIGIIILILILIVIGSWFWVRAEAAHVPPEPPPAPIALLARPIPPGPQAALLERGRYLTIAGDCVSCHTRKGGRPFAGGLGLPTPFGVIYTPNITGDRQYGIGAWTEDQFYRTLDHGVVGDGDHLYPAFPYTHFTLVTRADADAILAYLKTVPPARYTPPGNLLPFPVDIRASMIAWNALFFDNKAFRPDPNRPAQWNRGAYLVEGLAHCGACHTPRNIAGSEEEDKNLQGAELNQWVAPDLTGNPRTGLGRWSADDIAQYLRAGRNAHSNAAGPMAEVVSYSTSLLSDADLQAIATYLKSLPPSPTEASHAPDPLAMERGANIFSDACASCHLSDGRGHPGFLPPLSGSGIAQQRDPTGILHLILAGGRTGPTTTHPSAFTMPSFAWKLSDQEIADVATFVRNSWGNRAEPVPADKVKDLRRKLKLVKPLTVTAAR